jgi:hypothetical protein
VLRAVGETESTQEIIQDWLQLGEADRGFQLLTEEDIGAVIFFYIYLFSVLPMLLNIPFICFLKCFFVIRAIFRLINPHYRLIQMTSPINPGYRRFTVF